MHLGAIIGQLERERDAALALEALGDLVLYAEVARMAARFDETTEAYTTAAVSRFASTAIDAEWLSLVGALQQAEDPARDALARMLRWALHRDSAPVRQEAADRCASCGTAEDDDVPS